MSNKLFVGGLSWGTNDQTLRDFFAQAGVVLSASVIMDKFSGKSKGFGFVEMATQEEAQHAQQKLNGQTLDGRAIAVSQARPQAPREHRNSHSSGGGRFARQHRDDRGGRNW
jgi:RNA recognition motif-containing protein